MVSPELLRRYPFFAGLDHNQIVMLAKLAQVQTVDEGFYFFQEGDVLNKLYLLLEGAVAIVAKVPDHETEQTVSDQLDGDVPTKEVTISTVGTGNVFAWSALVPPFKSTASAKSITHCRTIVFDCEELRPTLEQDYGLGFIMIQNVARVIRERLRDKRIESLAYFSE